MQVVVSSAPGGPDNAAPERTATEYVPFGCTRRSIVKSPGTTSDRANRRQSVPVTSMISIPAGRTSGELKSVTRASGSTHHSPAPEIDTMTRRDPLSTSTCSEVPAEGVDVIVGRTVGAPEAVPVWVALGVGTGVGTNDVQP